MANVFNASGELVGDVACCLQQKIGLLIQKELRDQKIGRLELAERIGSYKNRISYILDGRDSSLRLCDVDRIFTALGRKIHVSTTAIDE